MSKDSRRRMSMQVVSNTQKVSTGPKHSSAPASASGGRRLTFPTTDRKLSLASSIGDGRKRSAHKLKKGKTRDGTPEKSGTPSQEALADDLQSPMKNVIWNEEIERLQIREEDLPKVHEPHPPESDRRSPATERLTVRKTKPLSELNRPKPKPVTVAKPAPHDAPVKPMDYSGFAGPRYDEFGNVVAHSILGNYDDFYREAVNRGDLLDMPATQRGEPQSGEMTVKYERKKRQQGEQNEWGKNNESNALRNWQARMLERKRQQGHISKLLQKSPEDLAMNHADNFRAIQEDRYIVDRTIPAVGYGKGYRVGSEFWKQQEQFGDDLTGVQIVADNLIYGTPLANRVDPDETAPTGAVSSGSTLFANMSNHVTMSMTLTQTEKGYPPPIEHVGIPASIREEKGWHWAPTHTRPMQYPWHKSSYLEQRKKQLKKYEEELDPHKPDYDGLEIIGTANPLVRESARSKTSDQLLPESQGQIIMEGDMDDEEEPELTGGQTRTDSNPTPVFGPSIQFAGQAARWTGDGYSFQDQVGIEARVNFETFAGDRVTSYLTIVNNGTTSVYYDWKKQAKNNPFELNQSKVQRFYFNNISGVVLPGETMKFPFVFKSPNAGIFQEQWRFETRPVVCGGAALLVTLRGIAFQEDKFMSQRTKLERELKQKEADQMVRHILEEIVGGMRSPARPSSPIDAYITDEEIFRRNNPKLYYHHDAVQELKQLYIDMAPEDEREGRTWDLCVDDLKDEILGMDDDDERKEPFLHQMNASVSKLSFVPQKPVLKQLYKAGYQILVEVVDEIVSQSVLVRQVMGLPEKEDDFTDDINTAPTPHWTRETSDMSAEGKHDSRSSRRLSRSPSKTPNPKLQTEDSSLSEGRGKKGAGSDKSGAKSVDKKPTTAKDKDKGGKVTKEATKTDMKSGKASTTPAPSRGPPSRGKTAGSLGDREKTGSPTSFLQTSMAHEDPVIDTKYKEKILSQAYSILGDGVDKMEEVFDDIIANDPARRALVP